MEQPFRDAVEVAERFSDGLADKNDLATASKVNGEALERNGLAGVSGPANYAQFCAWLTTRTPGMSAEMYTPWVFNDEAERERQASILLDLFGNPFRSVKLNRAWLAWNDATILHIAQAIYDQRAFDRMRKLADALEDAGCDNADILKHCREPGEHVRGCWVIDLLLGKE
jgi:hypothetical protein